MWLRCRSNQSGTELIWINDHQNGMEQKFRRQNSTNTTASEVIPQTSSWQTENRPLCVISTDRLGGCSPTELYTRDLGLPTQQQPAGTSYVVNCPVSPDLASPENISTHTYTKENEIGLIYKLRNYSRVHSLHSNLASRSGGCFLVAHPPPERPFDLMDTRYTHKRCGLFNQNSSCVNILSS